MCFFTSEDAERCDISLNPRLIQGFHCLSSEAGIRRQRLDHSQDQSVTVKIFFIFLLPAFFSARKLPTLLLGNWWGFLGGEGCVLQVFMTGTRACLQKTCGGRDFWWGEGGIKLSRYMGFSCSAPIPEFRHWEEESIIFDQSPFQHHLLSVPPSSLVTCNRKEATTSHPLVHMLGLALHICQSRNERPVCLGSGIFFFFFHENVKFMWELTKKSIQMSSVIYCLKLYSWWILLNIS